MWCKSQLVRWYHYQVHLLISAVVIKHRPIWLRFIWCPFCRPFLPLSLSVLLTASSSPKTVHKPRQWQPLTVALYVPVWLGVTSAFPYTPRMWHDPIWVYRYSGITKGPAIRAGKKRSRKGANKTKYNYSLIGPLFLDYHRQPSMSLTQGSTCLAAYILYIVSLGSLSRVWHSLLKSRTDPDGKIIIVK